MPKARKITKGQAGKAATTRTSPLQTAQAEDDTTSMMDDREDTCRDTNFGADEEEKIAQFFEDNHLFYDMADSEYKNTVKRRHLLGELAKSLGFEGEFYNLFNFSISFLFFIKM